MTLIGRSVTSELLVCNTSPAAAAASPTVARSTWSDAVRRSSTSPRPRPPRRHAVVVVVIDSDSVTSDAASFSYVDDPVISDVSSRASILRSAFTPRLETTSGSAFALPGENRFSFGIFCRRQLADGCIL